jgi:DNA-binding beta-propeller fold protein YncE
MPKRLGAGDYQYESVDTWPKIDIPGIVSDVATDSQDRVYLAVRTSQGWDDNTGAIMVFNRDGDFLHSFGEDKLRTPHGLWITPDDTLYLTDTFDHCVRTYSTSGEPGMVLGVPGEAGPPGCPFNKPTLAVPSPVSDDLFVSDGYRQNRVHRFSPTGSDPEAAQQYPQWRRGWEHTSLELTASWGKGDLNYHDENAWKSTDTQGTGPGEFLLPHALVVDKDEKIYVLDRSNDRVQVFDRDGSYLTEWGSSIPCKAFIDDSDVMHIAGGDGVSVVGLDGVEIGHWGEKGSEPWQFIGGPHGVWIDSHGDIYVAQVIVDNGINKYARA